MNPRKIKPYMKAHQLRQKMNDEQMWIQGRYIYEAVLTAVENNLAGRKSKLKYREESYTREWESQHLTESQKKKETIALFKRLELMQEKFEQSHPKKNNSTGE